MVISSPSQYTHSERPEMDILSMVLTLLWPCTSFIKGIHVITVFLELDISVEKANILDYGMVTDQRFV